VTPIAGDQRSSLRAHVLATGICGETRTSREGTVRNAELLAEGDPDKFLGIGARGRDAQSVMRAVADLCGCSASLDERDGGGVIEPDNTLDALGALAERLARASRERTPMLIATGHPTGLLPMYQRIARTLRARGVPILTPLEDVDLARPPAQKRKRRWRYLDGVAVLSAWPDLVHSHESAPMDALLDAETPGLVLADHGFAGAAIARGVETVCFTDVNDPALAVAKFDGLVEIVVPLDDNLPPSVYEPLADVIVGAIEAAALANGK
jgi:hypothetical protein